MQATRYQFEPMTADEFPLIERWLSMPHVAEWWNGTDEFELVSGDLGHPDMAQFIVSYNGQRLAYLQCYNLSAWNAGFGSHPQGTRGLDQFIGEANMLDRGHGSAFIREFTERLFSRGTPRVVIDPDPTNTRAIRAYEKAGFHRSNIVDTPDGPALLMVRNP